MYENGNLQFFNHAEGYVTPSSGSSFKYIYQFKDHLGNVRLSYGDNNNNGSISQSEIIEENNYYPFGLKHKGYNDVTQSTGNSTAQKFKYNGIEYEDNTGLYEMDVRSYDPAIARWTSIDPVTHHSMSTYTAFDNNPVYWADPSGADSESLGGALLGLNSFTDDTANKAGFSTSGVSISGTNGVGNSGSSGKGKKDPPNEYQQYFRQQSKWAQNEAEQGLFGNGKSDFENYVDGFSAGGRSTLEGAKSLTTKAGLVNAVKSVGNSFRFFLCKFCPGEGIEGFVTNTAPIIAEIANSSRQDQIHAAGFATEKIIEMIIARKAVGGIKNVNAFGLKGGYGIFGKKGLNVGSFRIEALYANPRAGRGYGTIFSLKQMKQGGSLFRWDYGPLHRGGAGLHSTIRFYLNETKYGSSAQRTWYPPYLKLK